MVDHVSVDSVLGGRYHLTSELAKGGMGTVFVGEDQLLGRKVAVKVLDPALARDDAVRARFQREAVAAARLSHPGVVAVYDTGEEQDRAYIVMEFVDGKTLREVIDERGAMPPQVAVDIAEQVADALAEAHRRGVVHRDVKPANILVRRDGRIQVADFGIAKAAGSTGLTRTGMVVGTARYLAPEQAAGRAVDARSDVYALGLVLYEMLSGKVPFTRDTDMATAAARLTSFARPIRELRPEVPTWLDAVLRRALARDPKDRYRNAAELAEALAAGADARAPAPRPAAPARRPTPPPAPRPPPVTRPPARPRGSSPFAWAFAVIAIAIAIAAVVAAFVLTRDDGGDTETPTTVEQPADADAPG